MKNPVVKCFDDLSGITDNFEKTIKREMSIEDATVVSQFPIIYIHSWNNKNQYEIYVGEANDFKKRTQQHYEARKNKENWQKIFDEEKTKLYVIGHEFFNKSMTLDLENKLMNFMTGVESVKKIHNKRGNPQRRYYPDDCTEIIFHQIWKELRNFNKELFPKISKVKSSAIFKSSPLHKLTDEQYQVKELILNKVNEIIGNNAKNTLIFVEGEAGTGKTVLNSSTFYEIVAENNLEECYLLVNHDEQLNVYNQITTKLGLSNKDGSPVVLKPTTFIKNYKKINDTQKEKKFADIVFVDEAHLLLTQGKQSYTGKNQLKDIIESSKVTVVMFDENQILTTSQYWENKELNELREKARKEHCFFELKNQLRMNAPKEFVEWIDCFTKNHIINQIPKISEEYIIKIFDTPDLMEKEILKKFNGKYKLSRLVATYDWDYDSKKKPGKQEYWGVKIGNWFKPWNRELKMPKEKIKSIKKVVSWAEKDYTISEIGSTFTVQGFDLDYVGVILGPSIKYRNGKIIFDKNEKKYSKMTQRRTLSNGEKHCISEQLIQNEIRVLMTRGVHGLFIYACDEELRKKLKEVMPN